MDDSLELSFTPFPFRGVPLPGGALVDVDVDVDDWSGPAADDDTRN